VRLRGTILAPLYSIDLAIAGDANQAAATVSMCIVNALSSRLAPGRTGVAVVIVSAGRLGLAHNKEADCRLVRRINRSADPMRP
jgi:hypothetical protein